MTTRPILTFAFALSQLVTIAACQRPQSGILGAASGVNLNQKTLPSTGPSTVPVPSITPSPVAGTVPCETSTVAVLVSQADSTGVLKFFEVRKIGSTVSWRAAGETILSAPPQSGDLNASGTHYAWISLRDGKFRIAPVKTTLSGAQQKIYALEPEIFKTDYPSGLSVRGNGANFGVTASVSSIEGRASVFSTGGDLVREFQTAAGPHDIAVAGNTVVVPNTQANSFQAFDVTSGQSVSELDVSVDKDSPRWIRPLSYLTETIFASIGQFGVLRILRLSSGLKLESIGSKNFATGAAFSNVDVSLRSKYDRIVVTLKQEANGQLRWMMWDGTNLSEDQPATLLTGEIRDVKFTLPGVAAVGALTAEALYLVQEPDSANAVDGKVLATIPLKGRPFSISATAPAACNGG